LRTEKIEIDNRYGEEHAGKYVFSEITWAKRSRIIQKHTKYHPLTGQVISSDYVAIQAETILASLKEQPSNKPISLEKLLSEENGVPIELGELFSQIVNRLCGLLQKKQKTRKGDETWQTSPKPHRVSLMQRVRLDTPRTAKTISERG